MRFSERKAVLLAMKENIEMELFSSEGPCRVIARKEKREERHSFEKRHLEHPLVPEVKPEPEVRIQLNHQTKLKTEPPPRDQADPCPPVQEFNEEVEIEMEMFPPLRASQKIKKVEAKSEDSSITASQSPNKGARLRWKRAALQRTGLVVRDVVCLPGGHQLTPLDRLVVPRGRERAALATVGMTPRITVDCGWSASQMQSRLETIFRGRFVRQAGQRLSFTYLQCVQGSRVLYVPETPAEGWTGGEVLRISGHGTLYILSHQEYAQQAETEKPDSETHAVNRKEFCQETSAESSPHKDKPLERPNQEVTLDVTSILRRFRQDNEDRDSVVHVQVKRGNVLLGALTETRRPGFSFRTTPIVSFDGEETEETEEPLREFFRLTLLELQQSGVFEGHPGCLLFTYDLAALRDRKYYEAGVLIGWSLAHGGPGPCCLHPALYQLMCGQNPSLDDFCLTDIVDAEVQIMLRQLHSCTDVKLLPPRVSEWVWSCGVSGVRSLHSSELPAIYIRVVQHLIYHRVASAISQFTEGLNSCGGLWETVQSHREVFVPVLTSAQQQPLTLEEMKKLFSVCYSHQPDSQLRAAEEATAGHWEAVLTSVRDGQAGFSFEDLLVFITGANHLPPLGFQKRIMLHFYSQNVSMTDAHLPYASTSALELFLPMGAAGPADLTKLLGRAVHETQGLAYFQSERDEEHILLHLTSNYGLSKTCHVILLYIYKRFYLY